MTGVAVSRAGRHDLSVWIGSDRARHVAAAAQLACLLEASAPKPGNVSPGRPFRDVGYSDFLASAVAIGDSLRQAATRSVGSTIRRGVEDTHGWVRSNTNLGIVLLLVPIARAALRGTFGGDAGGEDSRVLPLIAGLARELRTALGRELEATTVQDAREVYAAIRLAGPGGLGRVEHEDVGSEPSVTLLEAMRLAMSRDAIAAEYATGFSTTFDVGVPALVGARRDRLTWDDAVVETFFVLLAARDDTHVERRAGLGRAKAVSVEARHVLEAGGVRTPAGRRAIAAMDARLRDDRHTRNPGATADLTAAALLVFLLCGGWSAEGGADATAR